MKRITSLIILAGASLLTAAAQDIVKSLERNVPGQGKVTIQQDERISALLGKERSTPPANGTPSGTGSDQRVLKTTGYRVQVFAGNNTRSAKNEAYAVSEQVREAFPDLTVYTTFSPPRWICRAGDFRSIEEADATMRRLRATGRFKEVSIVKDQINIPL